MHIPDGLMAPEVVLLGWAIAIPAVAYALYKVNGSIDQRSIPLMAVLGAGIFVAQMLNFPIGGGTTGHLVGATLAVFLLGPWAGVLVITTILIIQCFVFGDGGLTALGLNITNMAVIGGLVSWGVLSAMGGRLKDLSVPVAAWTAIFLASGVAAIELALSYGLSPSYGIEAAIAAPSMLAYHALIGIGEAIITSGVVLYLSKVAPEMLSMSIGRKAEVVEA